MVIVTKASGTEARTGASIPRVPHNPGPAGVCGGGRAGWGGELEPLEPHVQLLQHLPRLRVEQQGVAHCGRKKTRSVDW